jgi:hypothetical protein
MYLRLFRAALSSITLLICLGALGACGGPTMFTVDDQSSWAELCPRESSNSNGLMVERDCNYRITTLTAEAACSTGDNVGCFLASVLYEDEDSPIRDHERAVEIGEWACEKGDPAACQAFAYVLFQGDIYEKGRAYNLMRQTCLDGMGLSCYSIAEWYADEPETAKEKRLAAGFFKRSCDLGYAPGCREFAEVYDEGFGIARNKKRARQLYTKACEMGERQSCLAVDRDPPHNKEDMWIEELGMTSEDYLAIYETACKEGFKHACTLAGLRIEIGDIRGRYITLNYDRAANFYREGCKRGALPACWGLAILVREGAGTIDANTKEAVRLAKKSCDGGYELGCKQYRDYRYRLWDEAEAAEWAAKCDSGDGEACYLAGRAYNYDVNFTRDGSRALGLLEKGCELDYFPACEVAGKYYAEGWGTRSNAAEAAKYYTKACEGGTGYACYALAMAYANGEGVEENVDLALSNAELACERDEGEACVFAGLRHEAGLGVDRDYEKARSYYDDGCSWRIVGACTRYGILMKDGKGGEENDEYARDLLARSCANDHGLACFELAKMYESGEGDGDLAEGEDPANEASPIEAADHFEMGCLAGHAEACAELARLHEVGKGVKKDAGKARMLRQKACMEGHEASCPAEEKEESADAS